MPTLDSLPDNPLPIDTLPSIGDADPFAVRKDTDAVVAFMLFHGDKVHGLGYQPSADGWTHILTGNRDDDAATVDAGMNKMRDWVTNTYGEDAVILPDSDYDPRGKTAADMGLEATYDCPECPYYKTGATTSPQAFLEHLEEEHGYSNAEAHEVLQN